MRARRLATALFVGLSGAAACDGATAPVRHIEVIASTDTIAVGGTTRVHALLRRDGGAATTAPLQWTSADPVIASVSADGLVTGLSEGVARIRASAAGESGERAIVVRRIAATLELTPTVVSFGSPTPVSLLFRDASGTAFYDSATVISLDTAAARIQNVRPGSATIEGLREGSATIAATYMGRRYEATLRVAPPEVTAIAANLERVLVPVGSRRLVPVAFNVRNRTSGALTPQQYRPVWTITDSAIASVDSMGVVSGRSPGETTITARVAQTSTSFRVRVVAYDEPLRFVEVSASMRSICGLVTSGRAYCWGRNFGGSLGSAASSELVRRGDGTVQEISTVPLPVAGTVRFRSLARGASADGRACAIALDGFAYCWDSPDGPRRVPGEVRFASLAVGRTHSCGLDADGAAWCWGDNSLGQLGTGRPDAESSPARVATDLRFSSLAVSERFSCATAMGGGLHCWGSQVATPQLQSSVGLGPLSGGPWICGLRTTATLFCQSLQLVNRGPDSLATFAEPVTRTTHGYFRVCAIGVSGRGYCSDDYTKPLAIERTLSDITSGEYFACALDVEGIVHCLGSNVFGAAGRARVPTTSNGVTFDEGLWGPQPILGAP